MDKLQSENVNTVFELEKNLQTLKTNKTAYEATHMNLNLEDPKNLEMKEAQLAVLLDISKEFIRICEENNLCYFACGGTALGAVRHKGFIPWDDDIDFMMERSEYNRFKKIARKALGQKYRLRDSHIDDANYSLSFIKIDRKDTTVIQEGFQNSPYLSGMYIDIFPLDKFPYNGAEILQVEMQPSKLGAFAPSEAESVPSTQANGLGRSGTKSCKTLSEAKSAEGTKTNGGGQLEDNKNAFLLWRIHQKCIRFFYNLLLLSCHMDTRINRGFIKNTLISIFTAYPTRAFLSAMLNFTAGFFNFFPCRYMGNLVHGYGTREVMEREIFLGIESKSDSTLIKSIERKAEFEGIEMRLPANPDAYLTNIYGDYMTLPPLEARHGHPSYYINATLPYESFPVVGKLLEGNYWSIG